MKNLRFIPNIHQQQPIVKVTFAFDRELRALVKSQKGVRWSQTHQSWCFPKKDFQLNFFYEAIKEKICVDYSKLILNTPPTTLINNNTDYQHFENE